jgi:GNAT superfamily N-acetyltransferase|uniref:N-acetyltransferase domain-containing protein n=1 Tax=Sipha flava TaxID=143950 RepID=A0A2S2PVE1_9HEMI
MSNYIPEVWKIMDIDFNGNKKKFIFQEIPENKYDEILGKFLHGFMREETICNSLNLLNDPESIISLQNAWKNILQQRISIGVFECNENDELKLAGCNILSVKNLKSEIIMKPEPNTCLTQVDKIFNFFCELTSKSNLQELFGDQNYIASDGLYIYPEYRKLGLAKQLLKLRHDIGKKYNIMYTKTFFTSNISQTLAESEGFETVLNYDYKDAVDHEQNILFPSLEGKYIKCMIKYLL